MYSSSPILILHLLPISITIIFFFLINPSSSAQYSINLPITKDPSTNLYLTRLLLGTPPRHHFLLVDLSTPFFWTSASTATPPTIVNSRSILCLIANGTTLPNNPSVCSLFPVNPVTGKSAQAQLVQGTLSLDSPKHDQVHSVAAPAVADQFLYVLAPPSLTAAGATGVLGLGRSSRISLPTQLSHTLSLPRRFSVCFSPQNGILSFGQDPGLTQITKSLAYAPMMISGQGSSGSPATAAETGVDYFVRVRSIEINGRKLTAPGLPARAKISSVVQYTAMGKMVYDTFMRGFEMAADSMKMKRMRRPDVVDVVGRLELCYSTAGVGKFPVVDLVMQSEMVRWRIHGGNLMVEVGENDGGTVCLGVVDGGVELREDEIVIGGYQLQDNLVEFDLENSMVGFSSSLLNKGTSCSDLSANVFGGGFESI